MVNKSHAAAYAVIGYCTAWLKYYYPTEFMAALMNCFSKDLKKISVYINHCKKDLGIKILPPNINTGNEYFTPSKNMSITYLLAVKNVGEDTIKEIIKVRNSELFFSMEDFFKKCMNVIDKKSLEALVSVDAFNDFNIVRSQYVAGLEDIIKSLQKAKNTDKRIKTSVQKSKENNFLSSQVGPIVKRQKKRVNRIVKEFVFEDVFKLEELIPNINEYSKVTLLRLEKKYLGVYISGHPLEEYRDYIHEKYRKIINFNTNDLDYEVDEDTGKITLLNNITNNKEVKFVAMINASKELVTKKKTLMAMTELEDLYGTCKGVIFTEVYEKVKDIINNNDVYLVTGVTSIKDDDIPCIFINDLKVLNKNTFKKLILTSDNIDEFKQYYNHIKELSIEGQNPVYFRYNIFELKLNNFNIDIDKFLDFVDTKKIPLKNFKVKF